MDFKKLLESKEYDFLRTNEHLGDNICMLAIGGSYAYGMNVETSDVDIRGCALNKKEEILTNMNFEQYTDSNTDTTIYSFNKLLKLLSNCNPNVIEMLGLKPEHYLYLGEAGKELIENRHMFLSKKAYFSFGGYAYSQLRRLDNKAARKLSQTEQEKHILHSIENGRVSFSEHYQECSEDDIVLYLDKSKRDDIDSEIFMDVTLKHYPLRDYIGMWNDMNNILKGYDKLGHRNENAIKRGKLAKHMAHLIRLYMMCHDILIEEEIITYREKEHDLLMDIRNGKYLTDEDQPTKEFSEMVDYYQNLIEEDKVKSQLPERVDIKKINKFMAKINEGVVKGS